MKKLNEDVKVKLEIETDDVAEIKRLLKLAGMDSQTISSVDTLGTLHIDADKRECDKCGNVHEGSCVSEEVNPVNLNFEDWVIQMNKEGAKVFKSVDPENLNAGVAAYGANGEQIGHFPSEVDETRGDGTEYDWGHRKYSSTGFMGNKTPDATDFHGRGDLRVRMHGRGDNAIYNVLVKEWQKFLREYSNKESKIGAAIVMKRGTTAEHINRIDAFLKQKNMGELMPHPRLSNKAIYIPSKAVDENNIVMDLTKAVENMMASVEERFGTNPLLDDWKIMYVFESIDEDTGKSVIETKEYKDDNSNNSNVKPSEESLYAKGMALFKDNYIKLLKSMSDAELENECVNQIYLSLNHSDDTHSHSHWQLIMCQDEASARGGGIYDRAMAKARKITNESAKRLLAKN